MKRRDNYTFLTTAPVTRVILTMAAPTIISMTGSMPTQVCRKPWRANILASARCGLFFIPLIIILPNVWGIVGVEACQALSGACSFLLTIPIMACTFKEFNTVKR